MQKMAKTGIFFMQIFFLFLLLTGQDSVILVLFKYRYSIYNKYFNLVFISCFNSVLVI